MLTGCICRAACAASRRELRPRQPPDDAVHTQREKYYFYTGLDAKAGLEMLFDEESFMRLHSPTPRAAGQRAGYEQARRATAPMRAIYYRGRDGDKMKKRVIVPISFSRARWSATSSHRHFADE